jgi:hypothetical protein
MPFLSCENDVVSLMLVRLISRLKGGSVPNRLSKQKVIPTTEHKLVGRQSMAVGKR